MMSFPSLRLLIPQSRSRAVMVLRLGMGTAAALLADPGAIARVIERFQNLNVVPRRVIAEFSIDDSIHIEVDVCGLLED